MIWCFSDHVFYVIDWLFYFIPFTGLVSIFSSLWSSTKNLSSRPRRDGNWDSISSSSAQNGTKRYMYGISLLFICLFLEEATKAEFLCTKKYFAKCDPRIEHMQGGKTPRLLCFIVSCSISPSSVLSSLIKAPFSHWQNNPRKVFFQTYNN